MGALPLVAGLGQAAGGTLLGLGSLDRANRLSQQIQEMLSQAPLQAGQNWRQYVSPEAMARFGISPAAMGSLSGQAGAIPLMMGMGEASRVQGLRDEAFGRGLDQLEGIQTDPWSEQAQRGMISAGVEGVNQASKAATERMRSDAASRGVTGGRWMMGQEQAGRMAAGGERARSGRELESKRSALKAEAERAKRTNLASYHRSQPIEGFDFSSYLGPAMNWDLQKANAMVGVQSLPINVGAGLGQGLIGSGSNILAANWTPTPQPPSGIPGMIGGIGGGAGVGAGIALGKMSALICVDLDAEVWTQGKGRIRLGDVGLHDHVQAADGKYYPVELLDVGIHAEPRPTMYRLTTSNGHSLIATGTHPVAGQPMASWRPGNRIPWGARQCLEVVAAVEPVAYRASGTIVLKGADGFLANGFACSCLREEFAAARAEAAGAEG